MIQHGNGDDLMENCWKKKKYYKECCPEVAKRTSLCPLKKTVFSEQRYL